jgi:hypothetical protein
MLAEGNRQWIFGCVGRKQCENRGKVLPSHFCLSTALPIRAAQYTVTIANQFWDFTNSNLTNQVFQAFTIHPEDGNVTFVARPFDVLLPGDSPHGYLGLNSSFIKMLLAASM